MTDIADRLRKVQKVWEILKPYRCGCRAIGVEETMTKRTPWTFDLDSPKGWIIFREGMEYDPPCESEENKIKDASCLVGTSEWAFGDTGDLQALVDHLNRTGFVTPREQQQAKEDS